MATTIGQAVVLVAGVALCSFALWGIFAPQKLLQFVKSMMDTNWGIYVAVIIRLILGAALIVSAPSSRFPMLFVIVGWIAIVAAVTGVILGRARLRRFVAWWFRWFTPLGVRLWLLIAVAFGAFLIYGAS